MVEIESYLQQFTAALKKCFGRRLVYVGLQGSYRRGEATDKSDVDVMVVLDELSIEDLAAYKNLLATIPCDAPSCGFICGKSELANWNPCEIGQLVHETKDYFSKLETLVPASSDYDLRVYLKILAGNLFHELCHRYIHSSPEENKAKLGNSYKQAFYLLQNLYFLRSGEYLNSKQELLDRLDGEERHVLQTAIELKTNPEYDFNQAYQLLFTWCQRVLQSM
jgi:predicted nucleotidyltransferase